MNKSYCELIRLNTFEERYFYLKLNGIIGEQTFGNDRYLNQMLYNSIKWKRTRDEIIIRDNGCDLALEGYEIPYRIYIHHINPITIEDIKLERSIIFDPDNLICVSKRTHDAIHFGDSSLLPQKIIERRPNDTIPWRC